MTVSHLRNEIKRIVSEYELEEQVTVVIDTKNETFFIRAEDVRKI